MKAGTVEHATVVGRYELVGVNGGLLPVSLDQEANGSGMVGCSVLSGELRLETDGTYQATIAGHPPVLKIDGAGRVVEHIGRGAYPLGVKAGLCWEITGGTLAPGERLLLHSDGLTESRNFEEREFGDPFVEVIASWHPNASAAALIDSILGEWRSFMGSIVPDDDVSIAVIRRNKPAGHD